MVDKVSLQRKLTHKKPLFLGEEDFSVSETGILGKGISSSPFNAESNQRTSCKWSRYPTTELHLI